MDNNTKVTLSESELTMVTDKNIILTKRAIIQKAADLFMLQVPIITNVFKALVENDVLLQASIPKITKGENYKRLPYVILDYPASFKSENIFAVRTMFWWGNFISITLHLKGIYKEQYFKQILKEIKSDELIFISMSEEEWDHDFTLGNFENLSELTPNIYQKFEKQEFIKIALKYELHHWDMMQLILADGYKKIAEIIKT